MKKSGSMRISALQALCLAAWMASAPAEAQQQSANPPVRMDKKVDSLFEAMEPAPGTVPDGHPEIGAGKAGQANPGGSGDPGGFEDPHAGLDSAQLADMPSLLPKAGPTPASSLSKINALEAVPVLHEGRLKPMITYARHMLLQFSGRTSYGKSSAMDVMARILFAPEETRDYRIFLINNPEVVEALGVKAVKNRRYSFGDLEKSLPKLQQLSEKAGATAEDKRDLVQKEILRVFGNVVEFVNLTRSFSFALPSPLYAVSLPETRSHLRLRPDRDRYSFWELMSNAQAIAGVLEGVGDRGDSERTPMEREIIALSQSMFMNSQSLHPTPFRILPLPPATAVSAGIPGWISPPEAVAQPAQLQSFHAELTAWSAAASAYREGNQAEFDGNLETYLASMDSRAYEQMSHTRFPLEITYQKAEPFYWSLVLYWLALLACFAFFLARKRWVYLASFWMFLAGLAFNVAGIVSRILIMNRPPVTTLYETFPFVCAVALLVALFLERFNKKGIGLVVGALLGVILMSIAQRYAAEGDTMKMLVAVLDSNFWLSTHVVTITIGYSACLLSGAIGHIWLVRALMPWSAAKADSLKEIGKMVYGTQCFGLLFSFIGTVLGGIWADQSWGRFWGWDPKENGALLIVIWCIILLHAKHWGYIRNPGMALGSVFGAIVVSIAWFGVNLLNVGLHSYGFTTGAASKLFAYIGIELLFMLVTGAGLALGWGKKPGSGGKPGSDGAAVTASA